MWTLLTGYLLSTFFEYQTIELFENKFSNETLSFWGILLGWLFQEYTREEFEFTGGKRFMLESDFRNRLFTQSLKIIRNLIAYPHLITILELGTFWALFGFFFTILIKIYWPKLKKTITKLLNKKNYTYTKNYEDIISKSFLFIYSNWRFKFSDIILFFSLGFIFKHGFFKIYFWYDTFFIFRPIFLILFIIFELFAFFFINYLIYTYIIYNFFKNLALVLKLFTTKLTIYFLNIGFWLILSLHDLNLQNLTTENFLKEVFFKIIITFSSIICSKQN